MSRPFGEGTAARAARRRACRHRLHRVLRDDTGCQRQRPQARYFSVGRIGRDQVADYADRKGVELAEAERWLRQNLAYEP
jgi:hypothetical protein